MYKNKKSIILLLTLKCIYYKTEELKMLNGRLPRVFYLPLFCEYPVIFSEHDKKLQNKLHFFKIVYYQSYLLHYYNTIFDQKMYFMKKMHSPTVVRLISNTIALVRTLFKCNYVILLCSTKILL